MTQITLAEPSGKSLFLQMRFKGTNIATGTGFVVTSKRGPVLITNWHNVTGRHPETDKVLDEKMSAIPDEIVIYHHVFGQLGNWNGKLEPLLKNDIPLWIEHPKWGKQTDFVALPLTKTDGIQLYPYDLVNTGPAIMCGPTELVSVVGFPFGMSAGGLFPIYATGFVASEPNIDFKNLPLFLIDCRARKGQSGSPVIAPRNGGMLTMENGDSIVFNGPVMRFLGIYSGRINEESDLGLVWKASAIRELVDSIR